MTVQRAAEELVIRAKALGHCGRTMLSEELHRVTAALPMYPLWLLHLLSVLPLCGLELGWQAFNPQPGFDGVLWLEVSNAEGFMSESMELYPGLAILPAGYINFGGDADGGGDPYFFDSNAGEDPPLYQVYHDAGTDAETILAKGRQLVAPRLSEFFRMALIRCA